MGVENKVVMRFSAPFWPLDRRHRYMNCTDQRFRFLNVARYGKEGVLIAHCGPPWSSFVDDELGSLTGKPRQRLSDEEVVFEALRVLARMFPTDRSPPAGPSASTSAAEGAPWAGAAAAAGGVAVDSRREGGEGEGSAEERWVRLRAEELRARLVDARVTRWQEDEWAGGSYSFLKAGYRPQFSEELARPEPNRREGPVFFAGEACAPPDSAQCVHGAMLTGRNAADCILRTWRERGGSGGSVERPREEEGPGREEEWPRAAPQTHATSLHEVQVVTANTGTYFAEKES